MVEIAHAAGVTVEASLGEMPLAKGGHYPKNGSKACIPQGIDMLAPSIGNIHCLYKERGRRRIGIWP